MQSSDNLPTLSDAFEYDTYRLQGINGWGPIASLGLNNVCRLRQLAQATAMRLHTEGATRSELRAQNRAVSYLTNIERETSFERPVLPRLRNELFHEDDQVVIYVGEISKTSPSWISGTVVSVTKGFNANWKKAQPNSGYYWHIVVEPDTGSRSPLSRFNFSNTEPRVLLHREFIKLKELLHQHDPFIPIFSNNAAREWTPLWCIENDIELDVSRMDYHAWLLGVDRVN